MTNEFFFLSVHHVIGPLAHAWMLSFIGPQGCCVASVTLTLYRSFWLIEHFYSAHIHSIECSSWPMFSPVFRRCHTLRWDWSVLPLVHHSIFPFENFGACWFLYVFTILWLKHRDCRVFIVRAWCSECWTSVYRLIRRTWESPAPSNSGVSNELENPCPWRGSNPKPLALVMVALPLWSVWCLNFLCNRQTDSRCFVWLPVWHGHCLTGLLKKNLQLNPTLLDTIKNAASDDPQYWTHKNSMSEKWWGMGVY
jgi:hypothetical protein